MCHARPKRDFNPVWAFTAACLLIAACLFGHASFGWLSAPSRLAIAAKNQSPPTRAIEAIDLGDNVVTQVDDYLREKAIGDPALLAEWERISGKIDPATTRRVVLEASGSHGDTFRTRMLCSLAWIEEQGAEVGETIDLSLLEQGYEGPATVVAIEPCPPIKKGTGRTVTGVFVHTNARVVDLYIDGLSEPLSVTANHPIYSIDRAEFVPAGELREGEQLQRLDGTAARVVRTEAHPNLETVYNIEVQGEHVYRVTSAGLLVHNSCALSKPVHANSHATTKQTRGYTLRDRTTGEPLKYGETTMGEARYSKKYIKAQNARMDFGPSGSKADMHQWQHQQILDYKASTGMRPPLNFNDY